MLRRAVKGAIQYLSELDPSSIGSTADNIELYLPALEMFFNMLTLQRKF